MTIITIDLLTLLVIGVVITFGSSKFLLLVTFHSQLKEIPPMRKVKVEYFYS